MGEHDALRQDRPEEHPDDNRLQELERLVRQQDFSLMDKDKEIRRWSDRYGQLRSMTKRLVKATLSDNRAVATEVARQIEDYLLPIRDGGVSK